MTDEPKRTEPSAIVIPFGKHKGATVAELLARDPAYADWVTAQGWVAERFAELHAAILSRGAGTDDTPEHNTLQARFLNAGFRETVIRMIVGNSEIAREIAYSRAATIEGLEKKLKDEEWALENLTTGWRKNQPNADAEAVASRQRIFQIAGQIDEAGFRELAIITSVRVEVRGIDVVLFWGIRSGYRELFLELKPSLGDDYPSVMRQMKRLGAKILVIGQYHGRGASEPELRELFSLEGMTILFLQEIEEALRVGNPTP